MHKKYILTILLCLAFTPILVNARRSTGIVVGSNSQLQPLVLGDGNINQRDQWTSTTTPVSSVTQTIFGRPIKITGLSNGCLNITSGIVGSASCGTGGGLGWASTTVPDSNSIYSTAVGNVGIGTTTPGARLNVVNNGAGETPVALITDNGVTTPVTGSATLRVANNGTGNTFSVAEFSSGASNMVFTNAGNLGIGTTTPTVRLHAAMSNGAFPALASDTGLVVSNTIVGASSAAMSIIAGVSGFSTLNFGDTADENVGYIQYGHSNNYLSFGASTNEYMRMTSGGSIGIGTSTPRSRLQVSEAGAAVLTLHRVDSALNSGDEYGRIDWYTNDAQLTGGAAVATYIKGSAPSDISAYNTTNPYGELQFGVSNNTAVATAMTLSRAGNLGIASSSPTYPLTVTGNMWLQGKYAKFGDSTSEYTCINLADACVELSGDGNTAGGVFYQVGNRNAGTSAYSGLTILNDLGNLGNNATYYAGLFLNSSVYSDPTFGTANNVPNILQLGNTMGSISIQASSTLTSVPSFIQFLAGGVNTTNEIARITTNGLGIGTSSPYEKLAIAESAPTIVLSSTNTSISGGAPYGDIDFTTDDPSGAGLVARIRAKGVDNNFGGDSDLTFWTKQGGSAMSEKIRFTSVGTLNIGTTTTSAFLTVENVTTRNSFLVTDQALDPTPFSIDNSGDVGIGTTSASTKLTIEDSSTAPIFRINTGISSSLDPQIELTGQSGIGIEGFKITYDNDTGDSYIDNISDASTADIFFRTRVAGTDVNALSILGNGDLGIGTTTATTKLNVYGGGIIINPGGTGKPTCDVSQRGNLWNTFGGAGVADTFAVCQKDAADAYSWVTK